MRPPLHGISGRLRRHITNVGAQHANRVLAARRKKDLEEDDFLRELLDSGRITLEQLQKMTSVHTRIPSSFEWMQEIEDKILDRADDVFLVKYGRDPTEDSDFRLNGDYYKICTNLQCSWHYYNTDLEKLRWDYQKKDSVVAANTPENMKTAILNDSEATLKRNKWLPLMSVLFFSVLAVIYIVGKISGAKETLYVLIGWNILAFPIFLFSPLFRCTRCGKGYHKGFVPRNCKRCGSKFVRVLK